MGDVTLGRWGEGGGGWQERPDFVRATFEHLYRQAVLPDKGDQYRSVREPRNWWDGWGREIGIVTPADSDTPALGEVKFQQQPVGHDVFIQLENGAPFVDWTPESGRDAENSYALYNQNRVQTHPSRKQLQNARMKVRRSAITRERRSVAYRAGIYRIRFVESEEPFLDHRQNLNPSA